MNRVIFAAGSVVLTLLVVPSAGADEAGGWTALSDPGEVKSMLAGKGIDAPDYAEFYREDGAMAYHNKTHDTVVVRKWEVTDEGHVCTYIYVKPDRLVECAAFARSNSDPEHLKMTIVDRGYSITYKLSATPSEKISDAINKTAGPLN